MKNPFQALVPQHVGGADTHHRDPISPKPCLSPFVVAHLGSRIMREPIYINRQTRVGTVEIQNVGADRVLPTKAQPCCLSSPQDLP
jgi:hypothetical protein